MTHPCWYLFFFFFNDTATTEIYTLSLHDASSDLLMRRRSSKARPAIPLEDTTREDELPAAERFADNRPSRSEEHTSELQSQSNLVCRLLLEKKKNPTTTRYISTNF